MPRPIPNVAPAAGAAVARETLGTLGLSALDSLGVFLGLGGRVAPWAMLGMVPLDVAGRALLKAEENGMLAEQQAIRDKAAQLERDKIAAAKWAGIAKAEQYFGELKAKEDAEQARKAALSPEQKFLESRQASIDKGIEDMRSRVRSLNGLSLDPKTRQQLNTYYSELADIATANTNNQLKPEHEAQLGIITLYLSSIEQQSIGRKR